MTKYAEKILDIINKSNDHLTAEQIYMILREETGKAVMATVYNNLNTLLELGEISKVTLPGKPDHYDKKIRHDHLICKRCGKISDVYLEDILEQLEKSTGVILDSYDLKMFYVCDDCRGRRKENK